VVVVMMPEPLLAPWKGKEPEVSSGLSDLDVGYATSAGSMGWSASGQSWSPDKSPAWFAWHRNPCA